MGKLGGVGLVTVVLLAALAMTMQACEDDSGGGGGASFDASPNAFEAGRQDGSVPDAPAPDVVDAAPDVVVEAALNDGSAPVELLKTFDSPRALAVDATFVYVATRNGIIRIAKDGSSTVRVTFDETVRAVVRDGTRLFFTTNGEVKVIPANAVDGGAEVTLIEDDAGGPLPVRASAGNVYYGAYKSGAGNEIRAIDEDGGNPRSAATPVSAYDFAAVGTTLFASSKGGADALILQLPGDGGAGVQRAVAVGQVSDFVVRDGYVYWSTRGGTVMRIPVLAGAEETVATGEGPVAGLAVDDANVYWVRYEQVGTDGVLRRAPKTGGVPPVTLASAQVSAFGLAVDDTHVYWTALTNDGGVMRVPK